MFDNDAEVLLARFVKTSMLNEIFEAAGQIVGVTGERSGKAGLDSDATRCNNHLFLGGSHGHLLHHGGLRVRQEGDTVCGGEA